MSDPIDSNEDSFSPQSDRLQILSPEEYELLWGVPQFSQYDRDLLFTLAAPEQHALARLRTIRTKAHFLLQLGYFRARQRFFRVEVQSVRDDIEYLSRRYLDNVINFFGHYQFDSDTPPVDIAEIGQRLASNRLSTVP